MKNMNQKLIEKLKEILNRVYQHNLSLEQVTEIANNLVGYFGLLLVLYQRSEIKNN